ncbi:MAG: hypothetical protein R2851_21430 [Caldilineaceae bacterium]
MAQKVGRRHEVGVEERDELTLRQGQRVGQRARLVAGAVGAVHCADVVARLLPALDRLRHQHASGRWSRPKPEFQACARIVLAHARLDQPFDDVAFVVDGQLDGDKRQVRVTVIDLWVRRTLFNRRGNHRVALPNPTAGDPGQCQGMGAIDGQAQHTESV